MASVQGQEEITEEMPRLQVFTKEAIMALSNEAIDLSDQYNENSKAIDYLQRALLVCKYVESSLPSSSFSSDTLQKIKSSITKASGSNEELKKRAPTISASNEIGADEGLHSYARTIEIVSSDSARHTFSFHSLEAVLCHNLGVCYLRENQDEEAALYFGRTGDLLQFQSTMFNNFSNEIIVKHPCYKDIALEPFHLDSITNLHNTGLLKYRAQQYEESLQCYIKAMSLAASRNDEESKMKSATALNSIGVILTYTIENSPSEIAQKTYADALAALDRSLLVRTNILGKAAIYDEDTGTVLNNMGRIHFLLDNFQEALNYHQKSFVIRKMCLGDHHIDTGVAAFNIGKCFQCLQKLDDAFDNYVIYANSLLESDKNESLTEEAILSFDHIAEGFQEAEAFDLASIFYDLALKSARQSTNEKGSFIMAQILNHQGNMFFQCSRLEDSLESYIEGLEIEVGIYPVDHPNIITTRENIERVLQFRNHR